MLAFEGRDEDTNPVNRNITARLNLFYSAIKASRKLSSVADPDNFAPDLDSVFKIPEPAFI